MCISPQRRAIFRHLNFQKWSEPTVFCTFWLANVLFATAAYNFSASELPKVVPDRQFFNIFTSECAFRHSGVQFFDIWTSKSGPGPSVFLTFLLPNVLFATAACNFWCHLSAPTSAPAALTGLLLDWPDTRIYEKNTAFRDFSNIWRACIFFSSNFLTIASSVDWLDYSMTWLLYYCFSTLHIVGSFYLNFLRL